MKRVMKLSDLKDSKLLYEKSLPAFGYLIIILVLALLIALVVWSVNTPKVDIIKSSGTVQSVNKNYAMSSYGGKILEINVSEGDHVQQDDVLFIVQSAELDLQKLQLEGQAQAYQTQIEKYGLLVQSIQEDRNLFDPTKPEDNLYYSQYQLYKSQVEQQEVDTATLKAYGYTDEQIDVEVEKGTKKVAEIYFSAIKSAEDMILQAQTQLGAIQAQLTAVQSGQSNYAIRANETGIIHMLGDYKTGMVVQAAAPIASISSERDSYLISALVPAADAARIGVGNPVDIAVSGFAQSEYGIISGTVVMMDSDVTMPQNNGEDSAPYFGIKIEPNAGHLVSKSGQKINLSNGMSVEARIKYDQVSYFDYVLESLGLLTR
jgi:multidrug efflux pump subunit AcrA (membrane-fusion protein)